MTMRNTISSGRSVGKQATLMAGRYFLHLEGKLVGVFLLLSLTPLIVVAAIAIHNGTQALEQHIGARLEVQAQHLMDSVDDFLASGHSSLQARAGFPVMLDVVGDDPDGRISRMLIVLEREIASFGALSVVNGSGKIVAASEPKQIGDTVAAEPWFREAVQRFASSPSSAALNMRPVNDGFRITIPLKVEIKGLPQLGFLSAQLSRGRLASVIQSAQVDRDSAIDVYLVGGLHEVIASGEVQGRPPKGPTGLSDLVSFFEKSRIRLQDARFSGAASIASTDGEPVLVGFAHSRRFPSMGWRVVTAQKSETALKPVQALRLQIGVLGAFISVLVIGLAMFVSRRVVRPIRAITHNAERVAAGELALHDLPVGRRDEMRLDRWRQPSGS